MDLPPLGAQFNAGRAASPPGVLRSAAVLVAVYVLIAVMLVLAGCQAKPVSDAPAIDQAAGTGLQIGDHFDAIIHHAGEIK